jgi:hypothetical protein
MRRWRLEITARPVVIREVLDPAQPIAVLEPVQAPVWALERRPWRRSRNAMMRETGCSPRAISSSSFSRSTS